MDNKTNLINNNIEKNISNEDIILAPPVELLDEAKEIERNTTAEEKFSFTLQYDSNQKEFLLSILQEAGAIVEAEDEKDHTFDTRMNMTQLAFVKRLDCVEKIMTNEGTNPFFMGKIKKIHRSTSRKMSSGLMKMMHRLRGLPLIRSLLLTQLP